MTKNRMIHGRIGGVLAGVAMATVLVAVSGTAAMAQTAIPRGAPEQELDVPAGPLGAALLQLGAQSGVQFNVDSGLTNGKTTAGLRGRYTVEQALATLLNGSGLTFRFAGPQTILIEALPDVGDAQMLGAVRVEGAGSTNRGSGGGVGPSVVNGINGSNDVTATEGTGSYTTGATSVANKVPLALKDTPQSVSVITSQQLDDQNITSFSDLMTQMPGISVVTTDGGGPLDQQFFSRGLEVQRAQIDGGAPIDISPGSGRGVNPLFDMAIYDHAEILRGADGLFNGYGDPGGVINLTRKRPLEKFQALLDVQAGSWNNYRGSADVTGPLTRDGKLRGRGILVTQDRDFFYDTATNRKWMLFGSLDYDMTPTTVVNIGVSKNWLRGINFDSGLPRFVTGADIGLPRDTCLCNPNTRFSIETTELFGRIDQSIGENWNLRLNVTKVDQETRSRGASVSGAIEPTSGQGSEMSFVRTIEGRQQVTADATLTGSFRLFGQDQRLVVGGNYSEADAGGSIASVADTFEIIPVDVFDFDPSDPRFVSTASYRPSVERLTDRSRQLGAYATLQLTVWSPLHLNVGLRYSRLTSDTETAIYCPFTEGCPDLDNPAIVTPVGGRQTTLSSRNTTEDFVWPPNASAVFDITRRLSVYGSYSRIFNDQSTSLDINGQPLGPITGNNLEAGIKWAPRDGRLNFSLSAYRIRQQNFAAFAGFNPAFPPGGGTLCCYTSASDNTRQSRGIDFEVTGELFPALQIAASYTYNQNTFLGEDSFLDGDPLQSLFPEHLYKLWLTYRPRSKGWLNRLNVGAGINGQSSSYTSGVICTQPDPRNPSRCLGRRQFFEFTEPAYAVVSSRVAYRLTDKLIASINANNLFDKRYYQTVGTASSGNFYGEPRNIVAALSAKF